jgi:hypothetical protein
MVLGGVARTRRAVELIYHEGCPRVEEARALLRSAFHELDLAPNWKEWRQDDPGCPAAARRLPSPTIRFTRRTTPPAPAGAATSCRLEPLPSVADLTAAIRAALAHPDKTT